MSDLEKELEGLREQLAQHEPMIKSIVTPTWLVFCLATFAFSLALPFWLGWFAWTSHLAWIETAWQRAGVVVVASAAGAFVGWVSTMVVMQFTDLRRQIGEQEIWFEMDLRRKIETLEAQLLEGNEENIEEKSLGELGRDRDEVESKSDGGKDRG